MNSKKCSQCGLINFATDETCKRCGATLDLADDTETGELDDGKTGVFKRLLIVLGVVCAILFICYMSLIATSDPISPAQQEIVERAIEVIEQSGFSNDALMLRHIASYRTNDNWWNATVGHADAYAATNFPFQLVTLYPDFFTVPVDDVERAAVLLHESRHLFGKGEPGAFENVWRGRKQLGWTKEKYARTNVWANVRESTATHVPQLFRCGLEGQSDCTDW